MSIAVPLDELAEFIAAHHGPTGYVITLAPDGRPRLAHVRVSADRDRLTVQLGPGGTANVEARPAVTVLFPASSPESMSLIVDGEGRVDSESSDPTVIMTPTWAVRHRPAP